MFARTQYVFQFFKLWLCISTHTHFMPNGAGSWVQLAELNTRKFIEFFTP
jgi:hypothetical protein